MAISGKQNINIGLPNESTGSDSLYTAFNKTKDNFDSLFANASPVPLSGNGITVTNVANVVTVSANLVAGENIVLSNVSGAIRIDSTGGNGGSGTITGVTAGTGLTGGGVVGTVSLALATTAVTPATYTNPTLTIDSTGRITSAANNTVSGTVTRVGVIPGSGISVSGSPVTTSGNITITNTGVTRLIAGSGITLSGETGVITVSSANLPANVTFTNIIVGGTSTLGNVTAGNLTVSGNANVGNLGTAGLIVATGNVTGGNLVTAGVLSVTGNANVGNLGTAGLIVATGNVTGGNLVTAGVLSVTGNANVGNLFSSGAITSNSATAGVGYRAGAGGTITQNTSKSDPVTLDKITGEITMNNATLSGDTTVSFTMNNSTIAATDVIILNQVSDANIGLYSFNGKCNSGNAVISVHNMTNTNRSDAIVIRFAVIKAVTS